MKKQTARWLKTLGVVLSIIVALVLVLQIHSVQLLVLRIVMATAGDWIVSRWVVAIDAPKFVLAADATLELSSPVVGLRLNGQARAYPIDTLACHQVVNDQVGDTPILVTYCPWSDSARVFDRRVEGQALEFSVKGIRRNNLAMSDKGTESEWLQMLGRATSGEMTGKELKSIVSLHTTWGFWKQLHPDTLLLSSETCSAHDHGRFPDCKRYRAYRSSRDVILVPRNQSEQYHPKQIVLGVEVNGKTRAYPLCELAGKQVIQDTLGNRELIILFDEPSGTVAALCCDGTKNAVTSSTGDDHGSGALDVESCLDEKAGASLFRGIPSMPVVSHKAFWFAWFDFHPDTSVWPQWRIGQR